MKRRSMRAWGILTLMIILFALSFPVETKETVNMETFGKVFINLDAMEKKQKSIKMNLRFVETYHLDLQTHMISYVAAIVMKNEQRKGVSKSEIIRVWQNCLLKHQGIEELYREWLQLRSELEKEVNISLGKL